MEDSNIYSNTDYRTTNPHTSSISINSNNSSNNNKKSVYDHEYSHMDGVGVGQTTYIPSAPPTTTTTIYSTNPPPFNPETTTTNPTPTYTSKLFNSSYPSISSSSNRTTEKTSLIV